MRATLMAVVLSLAFYSITTAQTRKPINIGQSLEGQLRETLVRNNIAYETWSLFGKADQLVTIQMDSTDLDAVVKLIDPQGRLLAIDDNSAIGYNARIVYKLPGEGIYQIEASTVWQKRYGSYKLTIFNGENPVKTGPEKLAEDLRYYDACLLNNKNMVWASELQSGRLITLLALKREKEAIEAATLSVSLAEQSGDRYALARAYSAIASGFIKDEAYKEAIPYFEKVLAIQQEINDQDDLADTLTVLADTYQSLDDNEQARNYYQKALTIRHDLQDRRGEGFALFGLAQSYRLGKQPEAAIPYYEKSLQSSRIAGNRSGEGYALFGLADCYRTLEQADKAIFNYTTALQASQDTKDTVLETTVLAGLADYYRILGDYKAAVPYYEQALTIRRQLRDRRGEAYTLNALAICKRNLSLAGQAFNHYQQMLAICRENKDQRGELLALTGMALSQRNQNQYTAAVTAYEQALVLARSLKDRRSEYNLLLGLAGSYINSGQSQRALPYLEQAKVMNSESPERGNLVLLTELLAASANGVGQYDKALSYLEEVMVLEQAAKDRVAEAKTWVLLATTAQKANNASKAVAAYKSAINIFDELEDNPSKSFCLYSLAQFYGQLKQFSDSQLNFEMALDFAQKRKPAPKSKSVTTPPASTFTIEPLEIYQGYVEMLMAQQQFSTALTLAERTRIYRFQTIVEHYLSQQAANQEASQNPNQTNQATTQALIQARQDLKAVTANEITQVAQQLNSTILNYMVTKEGLAIWLIKADGTMVANYQQIDVTKLNRIIAQKRLELESQSMRVTKLRTLLTENSKLGVNPVSAEDLTFLNTTLLPEPILAALPSNANERLIIVAPDRLSTIPFYELRDEQQHLLVDRFIISHAPSASALVYAAHLPAPMGGERMGNLAMGIPTETNFGESTLPVLIDAKDELKAAASSLKVTPITGATFTNTAISGQMANKHIVHLVSYAFLLDRSVAKSFINTSRELNERGRVAHNGLVNSVDFSQALTNTDLLILSLTQTDFSPNENEGLTLFTTLLTLSRCSQSLFSLWILDSKPNTTLIKSFSEQFKKGGDVAGSLQKAIVKVRSKYKTPTVWSAYVVYGIPPKAN